MGGDNRNRARERRQARRRSRKLFRSESKQPPEVYRAYLDGMVRGAQLRDAQEARIDDIPLVDIFGQRVSGLKQDRLVSLESEAARPAMAPVLH